jgi:cytochrome c2
MKHILVLLAMTAVAHAMDPQRGGEVLREQGCLACHNVRGEGARTAPDLAGPLLDHFTPSRFASLVWNHLPSMWTAASIERMARPRPSAQDVEDLFGYLYSMHFPNPRGTEVRGERAFEDRGCAACHTAGPGTPVQNWPNVADPFALVQKMWDHAPQMRNARASNGVRFERLSARDLSDLAVFASKGTARISAPATLPETASGEPLFKANCGACHPAIINIERRLGDHTPLEIAASLWNHAASMQTMPTVAPNSMRAIVGYVWNLQFKKQGSVAKGARLFETKRCMSCHASSTRGDRIFTPYSLTALVFAHGPNMQAALDQRKAQWPYLSPNDVLDILAYWNQRP